MDVIRRLLEPSKLPGKCDFQTFEFENVLGEGFFGVKYPRKCSDRLAIKIMKGVHLSLLKKTFRTEIKAVMSLEYHANIVRILGFCTSSDPLCIVMEYWTLQVEGQELSNLYMYLIYLRKKFETKNWKHVLSHIELFSFVKQIADGMKFLEKRKIVHGDLMTKNILINNCKILKISDFDFTKTKDFQVDMESLSYNISLRWAAPETVFKNDYSSLSDVWSFAVVIWEIGTLGAFPLPHLRVNEVISKFNSNSFLKYQVTNNFSEKLHRIMDRCWTNKDVRPNFEELYNNLKIQFEYESAFEDFNSLKENFRFPPTIETYKNRLKFQILRRLSNSEPLFKILKKLSEGNFGEVFLAHFFNEISGHKTVVLRIIDVEDAKMKGTLRREKELLERLERHENLVRILAFDLGESRCLIATEYVSLNSNESVLCNLYQHLLRLRSEFQMRETFKRTSSLNISTFLDHKALGSFALQIAKGMAYLESKNIIHGNLSAKNVLLSYFKTVKISDYGSAFTRLSTRKVPEDFCRWAAPEVLLRDIYSTKSDVWTFGIVLWEISNLGAYPYKEYSNQRVRELKCSKSLNLVYDPKISSDKLLNVLSQCLDNNSVVRSTFKKLVNELQHCEMTFYDFTLIEPNYVFLDTKDTAKRKSMAPGQHCNLEAGYSSCVTEGPRRQSRLLFNMDMDPPTARMSQYQISCACEQLRDMPRPSCSDIETVTTYAPIYDELKGLDVRETSLTDEVQNLYASRPITYKDNSRPDFHVSPRTNPMAFRKANAFYRSGFY